MAVGIACVTFLMPIPKIEANIVEAPSQNAIIAPYLPLGSEIDREVVSRLIWQELSDIEPSRASFLHERMMKTIECESGFLNIQSNIIQDGIREDSWGLVQIHLPSHPYITKLQALDPEISIAFMVDNFVGGKANMWSCYKIIYK